MTECLLNETGMMKDRMFQPQVASNLAKKALGIKSVWLPVVDDALKTCNEHGNQTFQIFLSLNLFERFWNFHFQPQQRSSLIEKPAVT